MIDEVPADETAIPRPTEFRIRCGVNAHVPSAGLDKSHERLLLSFVENVTRRIQKDDGIIPAKMVIGEKIRIGRRVGYDSVLCGDLSQGFLGGWDRLMIESGRFRKQKNSGFSIGLRPNEIQTDYQNHSAQNGEYDFHPIRIVVDFEKSKLK